MKEEVHISKEDEKAIIMSLQDQQGVKLSSFQITNYVKKYVTRISEPNLYRKIQRMAEKEYLLHVNDIYGNYIYYLNPAKDFILEGPTLKLLNKPKEGATEDHIEHFSKLKEAIQTWIDDLSEPYPGFQTGENSSGSIIAACEAHLLFQDLANHLPGLGIDVCEKWGSYKKELLKLDELKQNLISSLSIEILKCFNGLDLHFIYESEHHLADYECYLNPLILYDVVLQVESGEEGYDNHMRFLSWMENNAPIVEKGNYVLWGEVISYLRVPIKDRALLEAGVPKFLAFFKNIPDSEFMVMAENIIAKVDTLDNEREHILRELERAKLYASFPGECQYLG
jgi:hypothetical protein